MKMNILSGSILEREGSPSVGLNGLRTFRNSIFFKNRDLEISILVTASLFPSQVPDLSKPDVFSKNLMLSGILILFIIQVWASS